MKKATAIAAHPKKIEQTPAPVNRLGRGYFFDPAANRICSLPDQWRVYHFTSRSWIGGSTDSEAYLYLERLSSPDEPIPDIWADEDLDLYVCAIAPKKTVAPRTASVEIAGTYRNTSIRGQLAKVQLNSADAYLVLAAVEDGASGRDLQEAVLAIAQAMGG